MDYVKEYYKGIFRKEPMLASDKPITYISEPKAVGTGESISFKFKSYRNHYLYVWGVAATYGVDLLYEVIFDRATQAWRSVEPPSSIGDYRRMFDPPHLCREVEVKITNLGLTTRTVQVAINGWQRHEDYVNELHEFR